MRIDEKGISLAVVGASGAVGREVLRVLERRPIAVRHLGLFASSRSAGEEISVHVEKDGKTWKEEHLISELDDGTFARPVYDYAIFSAGAKQSKRFAPQAVRSGCVVIDNSSAFRLEEGVPLVVPPINAHALKGHVGIVANPNCTTAIALMALAPLHETFGLISIVGSTYQAVSGAGAAALRQLERETREWVMGRGMSIIEAPPLPHPILFNVIPHVEPFLENGYTREELKMVLEGGKILGHPRLRASMTCVRVPVRRAHSIDVTALFERPVSPEGAREVLRASEGIVVLDEPEKNEYPMPLMAAGKDECFVGRIRRDSAFPNALKLFICGDQLLRGAAWNAVEILEHLER